MTLSNPGLDGLSTRYGSNSIRNLVVGLAVFSVVSAMGGVVRGEELRVDAWIDAAHRMPAELAALDRESDSGSLSFFSTQPSEDKKASDISDDSMKNRYATAGSWRWAIYTGGAFDIRRDGEQYNLHFAASYFFRDDLNVSMEVGGLFFNEPSDSTDTGGFNFNLLMRWHFIRHDSWTLYADAGAGLLIAGAEIPKNGSEFNFTPQAGLGISYRLNKHKDIWLLTGVRWHHISNASAFGSDRNPGRNSIMAYVGIDFPF